ncbi:MATE family efflux transporter [Steroidobacter agaridevorans]|uniref:MATE family efflux transporter n=1 Tax=Steroidobacter agaridevorans TaxID=2695856 RepID=UPI00137B1D5B|nr:MATE family efflux transporter [Steroidobacter agaridevorans]
MQSLNEGPITRTLLQFALPILGMNVLQCLGGTLNAFWVGRYLGEAALSAVANAHSIMFLLTGAAFGVAMAASIVVGQCMGAGKISEAKRVVSTGAIVLLSLSAAMSIAGSLLAEPLLLAMKTAKESLALAISYTKVMFLALPILYMYTYVISMSLGTGDSKTPLLSMVLAVCIGLVFNPLFMFGGGPVPGAGIAGSALATLLAQAVSLGVLVQHMYRRRHPLCFYSDDLSLLRVDWPIVRGLLRMGVPMAAQALVVSSSAVLMIVLVNRFGVETTAAYGASLQLWTYIQLPALAIAVAVSSMTAQSVGAQNWERVHMAARVGVIYCTLATGVAVLAVYAADGFAYRLFLPQDSPALLIASQLNRVIMWSLVLLMVAVVLFGVMRATGVVIAPLFIHSLSLFVVRFPLALLLLDRWQADAIWWSFSISCTLDFVLATLYYRYGGWRTSGRGELLAERRTAAPERIRGRSAK